MNATQNTSPLSVNSNPGDRVSFTDRGVLLTGTVKTVVESFFFGGSYAIVTLDDASKKVVDADMIQALILRPDPEDNGLSIGFRYLVFGVDYVGFRCLGSVRIPR